VAEACSITNAAAASDSSLRDLRRLLWASIDNDDSLDLDQLSVAEQTHGRRGKDFRRGGGRRRDRKKRLGNREWTNS